MSELGLLNMLYICFLMKNDFIFLIYNLRGEAYLTCIKNIKKVKFFNNVLRYIHQTYNFNEYITFFLM